MNTCDSVVAVGVYTTWFWGVNVAGVGICFVREDAIIVVHACVRTCGNDVWFVYAQVWHYEGECAQPAGGVG